MVLIKNNVHDLKCSVSRLAVGGYPWWLVAGWHVRVVALFIFYFFQIFSYLIGLTCGPSKMNTVFTTSALASGPAGQKYSQFAINQ
jgi:hypothetical protein